MNCGKPIAPSNGTVTNNSTLYGSNATFACNRGYTLNGSMSTTCQRNGRWKLTEQSCIIIDCAKLPSLTDGTITYTMDTTYGSIANLTCNVGFNLTGDPNSVCTINGFWNSTEHSCIPIDCGHPPSIKNGTVYASKTTFASVARFTCEEGYKVNGSNVSVCLSNGVWTNTDQECHIIDCGLLPALKHGTVWYAEHTNITTYKSIASLECNKGYYHEGRNYSECTSSGNWDMYGYQDCVPLDCGPLDTILNAILTSKSTTYGTYSQIQCNEGYIFHGNDTTYCDYDGIWTNYNFNCTIVDCGTITPREYQDISYVGNLTTFKSRAIMVCKSGYVVNVSSGENSEIAACQGDGNWTMSKFSSCVPAVCPWFHFNNSVLTDELVREKLANNTSFYVNASINFNCEAGSTLIGYTSIICLQNGKWSGLPPKCKKENKIYPNCSRKNDTSGSEWPEISPGGIHTRPCSDVNSIGVVFRRCSAKGEWMLPVDGCVRREIETISAQVDAIILNPTTESIVESLDKLTSVTNWTQTSPDGGHGKIIAKTTSGELQKITNILDTLVNASAAISKVTNTQFEPFLETTSNLLDRQNTDSWKSINQNNEDEENEVPGALKVLHVVDRYTRVLANSTKHDAITTKTKNIGMYVGPIQKESTDIPLSAKDGVAIKSRVVLQIQPTLPTESTESTSVAAVVYRNLSGILSSNMMDSGAEISSEVVAVTLNNSLHHQGLTISLTLGYISESSGQPHCSFWNSTRSGWDGGGCNLTSFNDTSSTCVCNHLTNFAILMSPWAENVDTLALDIISIVGCSVSMLGLIITVGLHVYLWRYVKSDRVIILMNLSLALILSYAVFIGGVDRTENKVGCTAIAILLHYIYLAVFFLMLAEGIEIGITILFVFMTQSRLKWLLPAAWALPAVIVGIAMGATKLVGYGDEHNCWLSIEGGLIWAFVAPAALIIVVNCVVLILVINAMLRTKSLSEKSRSERSKAGVRCLCVLLPLMGCTWVIGLFYVHKSMAWIQYVFAVCNSLQGLVIFIFHCVLNVQVRNALQKQKHKKHSQSFMSTNKTAFVSTSFSEDSIALPRVSLQQNALRQSFSAGHNE